MKPKYITVDKSIYAMFIKTIADHDAFLRISTPAGLKQLFPALKSKLS